MKTWKLLTTSSVFWLSFSLWTMLSFIVYGKGEHGNHTTLESQAWRLESCFPAAKDLNVQVSVECCALAVEMVQKMTCLCAVLSDTVKQDGIIAELAATIPERCYIEDHPTGYQCGGVTLCALSNLAPLCGLSTLAVAAHLVVLSVALFQL